jgi:hypothetical protein
VPHIAGTTGGKRQKTEGKIKPRYKKNNPIRKKLTEIGKAVFKTVRPADS